MLFYLHMVKRDFWVQQLQTLWKNRTLVWLSGVRRAGKTSLCQALPNVQYFDCELPSIRREMEDPESFWDKLKGQTVILDEVHRLKNPSELLKVATDHYKTTRILATGSSTLGASAKFKDTLAGRKAELWLTPMLASDLEVFDKGNLERRFLRGGLPPFFLEKNFPEKEYQEWMDAYWAKDIQELFRLERRHSFQRFTELLFAQSGGVFEANAFAGPCEVSRTTIANYLAVLEVTYVVQVIRPFSSHRPNEIVAAPKVYAFDTGFAAYYKGWTDLRPEDMGHCWEHYVLNELQGRLQTRSILYWRDKRQHEVDFILQRRGENPMAIECKWSADSFNPSSLQAFRKQYPKGENIVVANDISRSLLRKYEGIEVRFYSLNGFIAHLEKAKTAR